MNEYNYCQEFYSRLKTSLMKKLHYHDFNSVFIKYDSDHDDLLTKEDMQKMMIDAGMKYVTFAEASFTFNLLGDFKPKMSMQQFVERMNTFKGSSQKQLIMYSQYLNVTTMRLDRPED